MNLIKPKKLKSGDTITFIAPAGNIEEKYLLNAKSYFNDKGYNVKFGKNILKNKYYLAGSDEERLADLHQAFSDPETNAIICARGGYGSLRLLKQIDYELIHNNPKIFCGYSDITALSVMFLKKSKLITFSSPMPKSDFQKDEINEYTEQHFFQTLNSNKTEIQTTNLKIYNTGKASGIMFGGNLSTLASLCGLNFLPEKDFIFFTEDLCEPVYKIDKYLRQLLNINEFKSKIKAIILGDFLDVENQKALENLFSEISQELKIPMFGGYRISHSPCKDTIPIGASAQVDNGVIKLEY